MPEVYPRLTNIEFSCVLQPISDCLSEADRAYALRVGMSG